MPHILTFAVASLVAGTVVALVLPSLAGQHTRQTATNPYRRIPPEVVALIEAAEIPFMNRDASAVGEFLDEDFTWYQVTEEGARQIVRGREATVALLGSFFDNNSWAESEVHRLGMLGNILVQVEVDTFLRDGKPVEMATLSVYEFRDGRCWREWKFYPSDKNPL